MLILGFDTLVGEQDHSRKMLDNVGGFDGQKSAAVKRPTSRDGHLSVPNYDHECSHT